MVCMCNGDLLKVVKSMQTRVGRGEALRLLVVAGISPHTALRLCSGRYLSKIGVLVARAIREADEASKSQAS